MDDEHNKLDSSPADRSSSQREEVFVMLTVPLAIHSCRVQVYGAVPRASTNVPREHDLEPVFEKNSSRARILRNGSAVYSCRS